MGKVSGELTRDELSISAFVLAETLVDTARYRLGQVARVLPRQGTAPGQTAPGSEMAQSKRLGRYTIQQELGSGAMGVIYAAYDPELDRRVAIKLLAPRGRKPLARERLAQEARALARLSHPNVVQIYDVGVHGNSIFFAMELVEGQSLWEWGSQRPRPGWRQILAAYLEAARGLAAAHAAGLVHRDFKPANVLMGKDGRVRVADFGLALAEPEAPDSEAARSTAGRSLPGLRLTAVGTTLGTPAYMAPEQLLGTEVGPTADQYSFCVSLYEALYDQLPLGCEDDLSSVLALLGRKLYQPPERPSGAHVPEWLHQVIVRGLAARPEDRWPSMDALIAAVSAALEADPAARRWQRTRPLLLGSTVAILSGLVALGALHPPQHDPAQACMADAQLAGVWDPGMRARTHQAFLGTRLAYAQDTFDRVATALDAYARTWEGMRTEVCEATYVHHRQPADVLGLRVACLERRRSQLQALTAIFVGSTDAALVPHAVQAVRALPPVTECADVAALAMALPPPADPAVRAQVDALQSTLDHVEALYEAGKYQQGMADGERVLGQASALGYAPLEARAMYWIAKLRDSSGNYAGAEAMARSTIQVAARAKDDALAAKAWSQLLWLVGYRQARFDEALAMTDAVLAAVERADDDLARAGALSNLGAVLVQMGRYDEARVQHQHALAIREQVLGPDHPHVATSLNNLGTALHGMGRYEHTRAQYERARTIWEQALGPDHPDVGIALTNLGSVLHELGEYERARTYYERAWSIWEKAVGPDHPELAYVLTGLGRTLVRTEEHAAAERILSRALELREQELGPGHPELAETLLGLGELALARSKEEAAIPLLERALALGDSDFLPEIQLALAQALWSVHTSRERALSLAQTSLEHYRHMGHGARTAKVEHWLAARSRH